MRLSKEFVAGLSLTAVVAVGLGTAACSAESGTAAPSGTNAPDLADRTKCISLTSFNLIGGSKSGGENAVNTGECAKVRDLKTYEPIGTIAGGQAFVIDCYNSELMHVNVEAAGITGYMFLSDAAWQGFRDGAYPDIPSCKQPEPSTVPPVPTTAMAPSAKS